MIYLELILGFLEVGIFSFGGAYGAIPLIRDVALRYGWLTEERLLYFIAVCESTPGPIMVNMATYVGASQAGLLGAALATLTVILPAFVIILLVTGIMAKFMTNPWVKAIMAGLKPCVIGIILATGGWMVVSNVGLDIRAVIITALLGGCLLAAKVVKKKLSPIALIAISAVLGAVIYGI